MFDGIDGQSLILYIFLSSYLFFFHNVSFSGYLLIPLIVSLFQYKTKNLFRG